MELKDIIGLEDGNARNIKLILNGIESLANFNRFFQGDPELILNGIESYWGRY